MKSIVGENWSGTSIWVGFFKLKKIEVLKTFNPNTIDTVVVSIRHYSVSKFAQIGTVLPFRIQLKTFSRTSPERITIGN